MSIDFGKVGSWISNAATKTGEGIKNAALWAGRMITIGYHKSCEAIKTAWNKTVPFIKSAAQETWKQLNTARGGAIATAVTGLAFSIATVSLIVTDKGNPLAKKIAAVGLGTLAIASFLGTGIFIGLGITNGWDKAVVGS